MRQAKKISQRLLKKLHQLAKTKKLKRQAAQPLKRKLRKPLPLKRKKSKLATMQGLTSTSSLKL